MVPTWTLWALCAKAQAESCTQLKEKGAGPSRVAQLVRASSQYTKTVGSIPSQNTYRN